MAANPSTEQKTTAQQTRKITTYDLVIGILAIFSLAILILPLIVQMPASSVDLLNTVENLLCIVFLADFLRSLFRAPNKWGYFLKGGGWLDLLGSIPFSKLAVFRFARLFRITRAMRTLKGNDFRKMLTAEQSNPHANITTYPNAVW